MPRNINACLLKVACAPLGQQKNKSFVIDKSSIRPACDQAMDRRHNLFFNGGNKGILGTVFVPDVMTYFVRRENAMMGSVEIDFSEKPRAMRSVVEIKVR